LDGNQHAIRQSTPEFDESLLRHLSPLGWEHINLTGDYMWKTSAKGAAGKFKPLRPMTKT
jgi:Tn3 transposase DDE domain